MQRKLVILGYLLVSWLTSVHAQFLPIIPNDSGNVSWQLKQEVFTLAFPHTMFLGDTISIDSINYHKVDIDTTLVGYLREDTVLGKTWFRGSSDTAEYLIMDLTLNLGDTFNLKMTFNSTVSASVIWIDTIGGRKRILFNYSIGTGFISENFSFIEGVGPNASVLYAIDDPTPVFDATNSPWGPMDYVFLVCNKYHDTLLAYAWDTVNYGCGQFVSIEDPLKSQARPQVLPNPSTGLVSLYFDPSFNLTRNVTIYDLSGRSLEEFVTQDSFLQIDLCEYGSGVYVYRVTDRQSSAHGRIIID